MTDDWCHSCEEGTIIQQLEERLRVIEAAAEELLGIKSVRNTATAHRLVVTIRRTATGA